MKTVQFTNAYYIKLGRKGAWETDSIETGKLRLGWKGQTIADINGNEWEDIERQLRSENEAKPKSVATTDLNALKCIAQSTPDDIWITFYKAKLWWARIDGPVQEDHTSKFRVTIEPWRDKAINGKLLFSNELPGKISQLQGFRGTACRVKHSDLLRRTLSGTRSPLATDISNQLTTAAQLLASAIKELHWKDFETLVDLIFRAAGLVRVSVLGQHAKAYDLELREPITQDRFVVQVKSKAALVDLEKTVASFAADDYRRVFFVVHSPAKDLASATSIPDHVEVISPERLGQLALESGLAGWLEDKVA
jgi:hypothetical protein